MVGPSLRWWHGISRLWWVDRPTGRVIRRIENRSGELVHIDVKKLARPDSFMTCSSRSAGILSGLSATSCTPDRSARLRVDVVQPPQVLLG